MPITLNGTTGVVTPGATVGSITGVLKATSGVISQAIVGTDYSDLTLATAQTASGTAVDFTGIPSWAKRITVMFNGVSTSGSSNIQIQLGNGALVTSGYSSTNTAGGNSVNTTSASTGHLAATAVAATMLYNGHITFTQISSNLWIGSSILTSTSNLSFTVGASNIFLASSLDRLRITTVNGIDTFDAGTINISYE